MAEQPFKTSIKAAPSALLAGAPLPCSALGSPARHGHAAVMSCRKPIWLIRARPVLQGRPSRRRSRENDRGTIVIETLAEITLEETGVVGANDGARTSFTAWAADSLIALDRTSRTRSVAS